MKYDGGDGRSHRNMKQEVYLFPTCEMGTIVLTMVVLFAASSKRKKFLLACELPEGKAYTLFNSGPHFPLNTG